MKSSPTIKKRLNLIFLFATFFSLWGLAKVDNRVFHAINIAAEAPDSTLIIAQSILNKTPASNQRLRGECFYALGEGYYFLQQYDSALIKYKYALDLFRNINDSSYIAATQNNIGLLNYYKGNYDEALTAYQESLQLEEQLNNPLGVAKSHQNLGLIYSQWGKTEQQKAHNTLALDIYTKLDDKESIANLQNNLGVLHVRLNEFDTAFEYYQSAYNTFKSLDDKDGIATSLSNLASLFQNLNQLDRAVDYYNQAIAIFTALEDKHRLIYTYSSLGDVFHQKGNQRKAIEYYTKAEDLNQSLGIADIQLENMESLYNSYKAMEDYKNANRILESLRTLNDSIYDEETLVQLTELEKKYNYQKSQKELLSYKAQSEKRRILLTGTIILALFIIVLLIFVTNNARLKEKQRRLALEQEILRTQMNPHFIFNSLSGIQCFILDKRLEEASEFVSEFSGLMRLVLQFSQKEKITLAEEKEMLNYYFNLQNRRFNNKIQFEICSSDDISDSKTLIPPMLAQPFIENAIEHGRLAQFDDGLIKLQFLKAQKKLVFSIEDNGIGIEEAMKNKPKKTWKSMAIDITKKRLKLINGSDKGHQVDLNIVDLSQSGTQGTRVEFHIPYEELN
jgi:tetratricopeptide (TPR) repeat protein